MSEIIDRLDLQIFYARYDGDGRRNQPYDPTMLVKVLVYGYAMGVFSSRKMARKLYEDVAFRMLGAGNFPSHRPICDFRFRHLPELKELFIQVVRLARELGWVKLGLLRWMAAERSTGETESHIQSRASRTFVWKRASRGLRTSS